MDNFTISTKIFPLDVIQFASFLLLDDAYILLDGTKEKVKVTIRSKTGKPSTEQLINRFHEEMINYSVFKLLSEKNKEIKHSIIKRILVTNGFNQTDS